MNKRVNFEDSLFILMMRIRMIQDIITLDADPELFLEKTLDDVGFIDDTLRILLGYLQENDRLIDRDELLEHLSELEWQFSRVLQELLNHEGSFSSREIPSISEKLMAFRNSSLDRRKTVESLGSVRSRAMLGEPVVSSDELTELLKAF